MIGSDLPSLPTSHLAQAFQYLRDRPDALVIGPATDGGYYLIGLRRPCPALFTSIAFGHGRRADDHHEHCRDVRSDSVVRVAVA